MADGFLGRWSRRKLDGRKGQPLDEPAPPSLPPSPASGRGSEPALASQLSPPGREGDAGKNGAAVSPPLPLAGEGGGEGAIGIPAPTLEDAQVLTPESDFTPFVARGVAPEVRNAAMKKLFADPHFNVMDRLDIYIDDYSQPDPLPASMLRQMASAKFLKLVDDEADTPAAQSVAQSADRPPGPTENNSPPEASPTAGSGPADPVRPPLNTEDHANTDLRLQQNHAAGAPLAEREPDCRPRHGAS